MKVEKKKKGNRPVVFNASIVNRVERAVLNSGDAKTMVPRVRSQPYLPKKKGSIEFI